MTYIKINNQIQRRQPSIMAIQDAYQGSSFSFSAVERSMKLGISKTSTKGQLFMTMICLFKYWKKMLSSSPNRFLFLTITQQQVLSFSPSRKWQI